ncbi:MAG: creatininase family protein, partial [Acidimicrobiales bacterium]
WHSHHLPLGLDGLVAADICGEIAEACEGVSGPVSYWGIGGVPYPYTLKLPIELVEPVLSALFEQFGAMGFRVILAFAGHFGVDQTLALKRAAVEVMDRSPVTVLPLTEYDLVTDLYTGDHAGPGETSLMWAVSEDLVRLSGLDPATTLDGVIGDDPRLHASMELGVKLKTAIVERSAQVALRALGASALERQQFVEAVRAAVRAVEEIRELRLTLPKSSVPPLVTPSYASHCAAIWRGDYVAAKKFAEDKLADPSS